MTSQTSIIDICQLLGLPQEIAKSYNASGVFFLYDWQMECLNSGVLLDKNLVYCAPTSGGKTLIAELIILKTVFQLRRRAIFIMPYVSLVSEKEAYLKKIVRIFNRNAQKCDRIKVAAIFGDISIGKALKDHIIVCTIEKANNIINMLLQQRKVHMLGCVAIDEMHMMGDPSRGYLLEIIVSQSLKKKLNFVSHRIRLLGLSATVGNIAQLAYWFGDAVCYESKYRPIPLLEHASTWDPKQSSGTIYNKSGEQIPKAFMDPSEQRGGRLSAADQDFAQVRYLSMEAALGCEQQVLIFCPSRYACQSTSEMLAAQWSDIGKALLTDSSNGQESDVCVPPAWEKQFEAYSHKWDASRLQVAQELLHSCNTTVELCKDPLLSSLYHCVLQGIAFHHAGLTSAHRLIIETAYKRGLIRILAATSTLAAGVNLPAGRVLIRSMAQGKDVLTVTQYRQMCGRAGRAGIMSGTDKSGETYLLIKPMEIPNALTLMNSPLPNITSQMSPALDGGKGLLKAVMELFTLELCFSLEDVCTYAQSTLLYHEQCGTSSAAASKEISAVSYSYDGAAVGSSVMLQLPEHNLLGCLTRPQFLATAALSALDAEQYVLACSLYLLKAKAIEVSSMNTADCFHLQNIVTLRHEERLSKCGSIGDVVYFSGVNSGVNEQFLNPIDYVILSESELLDGPSPCYQSQALHTSARVHVSRFGRAILESSLSPDEALIIYEDLLHAQNGINLQSNLHLLYLVTSIDPSTSYIVPNFNKIWSMYGKAKSGMPGATSSNAAAFGAVVDSVKIDEALLFKWSHQPPSKEIIMRCADVIRLSQLSRISAISASAPNSEDGAVVAAKSNKARVMNATHAKNTFMSEHEWKSLCRVRRLWSALILTSVVDGNDSLSTIGQIFGLQESELEQLRNHSHILVHKVQRLCGELGWGSLSRLFETFKPLLDQNIPTELKELMSIPGIPLKVSRVLHANGYSTALSIAEASSDRICHILQLAIAFDSKDIEYLELDQENRSSSINDDGLALHCSSITASDESKVNKGSTEISSTEYVSRRLQMWVSGMIQYTKAHVQKLQEVNEDTLSSAIVNLSTADGTDFDNEDVVIGNTDSMAKPLLNVKLGGETLYSDNLMSSTATYNAVDYMNEEDSSDVDVSFESYEGDDVDDKEHDEEEELERKLDSEISEMKTFRMMKRNIDKMKSNNVRDSIRDSAVAVVSSLDIENMTLNVNAPVPHFSLCTDVPLPLVNTVPEQEAKEVGRRRREATPVTFDVEYQQMLRSGICSPPNKILKRNSLFPSYNKSPTNASSSPANASITMDEELELLMLSYDKLADSAHSPSAPSAAVSEDLASNVVEQSQSLRDADGRDIVMLSDEDMYLLDSMEVHDDMANVQVTADENDMHDSLSDSALVEYMERLENNGSIALESTDGNSGTRSVSQHSAKAEDTDSQDEETNGFPKLLALSTPVTIRIGSHHFHNSNDNGDKSIIVDGVAATAEENPNYSSPFCRFQTVYNSQQDSATALNGKNTAKVIIPSPYLTPFTPSNLKTPGKYLYIPLLKVNEGIDELKVNNLAACKSKKYLEDVPQNPSMDICKDIRNSHNCQFFLHLINRCSNFSFSLIYEPLPLSSRIKNMSAVARSQYIQSWQRMLSCGAPEVTSRPPARGKKRTFNAAELLISDDKCSRSRTQYPQVVKGIVICVHIPPAVSVTDKSPCLAETSFFIPLPCLPRALEYPLESTNSSVPMDVPVCGATTFNMLPEKCMELICRMVGFPCIFEQCPYLRQSVLHSGGSYPTAHVSEASSLCSNPLMYVSRKWAAAARKAVQTEWRKGGCAEWRMLADIMANKRTTKTAIDMKYQLLSLRERDCVVHGPIQDPSIAQTLLNKSLQSTNSAAVPLSIEPSLLHENATELHESADKRHVQLIICLKIKTISRLMTRLSIILRKNDLWNVFSNIEMPLLYIVSHAEYNGVPVDVPYFARLRDQIQDRRDAIQHMVSNFAACINSEPENQQEKVDFNIDSHVQMNQLKKTLVSQHRQQLEQQHNQLFASSAVAPVHHMPLHSVIVKNVETQHPVFQLVQEYRSLSKGIPLCVSILSHTFKLPSSSVSLNKSSSRSNRHLNTINTRIRATFNCIGADTGRMTVTSPPLQQTPHEIRYKPPPERLSLFEEYQEFVRRQNNGVAVESGDGKHRILIYNFRKNDLHVEYEKVIVHCAPTLEVDTGGRAATARLVSIRLDKNLLDDNTECSGHNQFSQTHSQSNISNRLSLLEYWRNAGVIYSMEQAKEMFQVQVSFGNEHTCYWYPADRIYRVGDVNDPHNPPPYVPSTAEMAKISNALAGKWYRSPLTPEEDWAPSGVGDNGPDFVCSTPRTGICSSPGYVLLSADYCQIELRLMAHFSNDKSLCEPFMNPDVDVFRCIASRWRNKPEVEVSDVERQDVKHVCYALLYGAGARSIAEQSKDGSTSIAQASAMIQDFLHMYPGIKQFMESVKEHCRCDGNVETMLGRKRYIPFIKDKDWKLKSHAERQAVNTVCQGSAADLIKLAMINIYHAVRAKKEWSKSFVKHSDCMGNEGHKPLASADVTLEDHTRNVPGGGLYNYLDDPCRLVLQVHDELIFEVKEEFVDEMVEIVQYCMENAVELNVPLQVKVHVGTNWEDMTRYSRDARKSVTRGLSSPVGEEQWPLCRNMYGDLDV